ncbi:MAG TPA: HlyD family efflux transporter periplasmic adaptor subunit [Bacteroidota bacterium]|nr:HlyD family efflux transporter periplasmic adaptor subunit [Bacteroidota bacterium]
MIIPGEQASDTLAAALGRPSSLFRAVYYAALLMLLAAFAWASLSVVAVSIKVQGVIRPSEGVQTYAGLFNTMIESVYVSENQRILKGDTLIVFAARDLEEQLTLAVRECAKVQSEINDLTTLTRSPTETGSRIFSLKQYEAEYDALLKDVQLNTVEIASNIVKFNRARELKEKLLISEAEFEDAKRTLELSQTKLESFGHATQSRFEQELFSKQRSLHELQSRVRLLTEERRQRCIIANADGVVFRIPIRKGGVPVVAGQELVALTPSTGIRSEFFVPARDIGFIREGLAVHYEIDAYPFQEWGPAMGRIVSVSNDVVSDPANGMPLFKVTGSLESLTLRSRRTGCGIDLRRGLTFRANIIVAEKRLVDMLYDKTVSYFVFR